MIVNQGETRREANVSEQPVQDDKSVLPTAKMPTEPTEIVISAYTDMARRGSGWHGDRL